MDSATSLRKLLHDQGRNKAWLARQMGYHPSYTYDVLNGQKPMSEEFRARALDALGQSGLMSVQYRGRTVRVPENIYRLSGDPMAAVAVADAYEEAWKRSWLDEHSESALALAADRAWRNAVVLAS